jgi:hypothetical protein
VAPPTASGCATDSSTTSSICSLGERSAQRTLYAVLPRVRAPARAGGDAREDRPGVEAAWTDPALTPRLVDAIAIMRVEPVRSATRDLQGQGEARREIARRGRCHGATIRRPVTRLACGQASSVRRPRYGATRDGAIRVSRTSRARTEQPFAQQLVQHGSASPSRRSIVRVKRELGDATRDE